MASAAKGDTVWIGFMDIVPVIGTVKEAVELVLALYEGDKAMISKKEKAFENIVKESLKKHVKSTPAAAPAAAAADEYSGLRNVKEVRKEKIIEYMQKGGKRGTKPTAAEQKARQKRVENVMNDMLEKIKKVNQNYNEELKIELEKRSGRGEHVFNNNILRFHSVVLNTFKQDSGINNMQGHDQIIQAVDALGNHTLPPNTAQDIQQNMVVHFEEDEFYVNVNAVMYGEYCRVLRAALLDVLRHINPDDVTEEEKQRVNFIIDNMNNLEIYVDEFAKTKWIGKQANGHTRFNQVKGEVVNMYRNDRGNDWCLHILGLVAPLFNEGQ